MSVTLCYVVLTCVNNIKPLTGRPLSVIYVNKQTSKRPVFRKRLFALVTKSKQMYYIMSSHGETDTLCHSYQRHRDICIIKLNKLTLTIDVTVFWCLINHISDDKSCLMHNL